MLSVDHSNIDGPPFAVKCEKNSGPPLVEKLRLCVLVHALPKVRNFEHVMSKLQREDAIAYSHLHECC